MRVLIVSHGHPALSAGGAEIAAYNLFLGLKSREGIEAMFVAWSDSAAARKVCPQFTPFEGRADELLFFGDGFDRFTFSWASREPVAQFAALLSQWRPDVVHFHHYVNVGLELIGAARRMDSRPLIILTLHEFLAICHNHGTMVRRRATLELCDRARPNDCAACFSDRSVADFESREARLRDALAEVDLFLSPSRFLRERYIAWGLEEEKIVEAANGIALADRRLPRARPHRSAPDAFGYFGQIHPYKGLLELLAAFVEIERLVGASAVGPTLTIHGAYLELNDPAYLKIFKSLLAACGRRVHFAGGYARADLTRLMAAVDWVVAPSIWWENSPLVIEEALAHGRPVICSDIGGMAEKVRWGKDGYHFRAGDSRALAALLLRVSNDGAAWNRLVRSARRPITLDECVDQHMTIYRNHRNCGVAGAKAADSKTANSGSAQTPPCR